MVEKNSDWDTTLADTLCTHLLMSLKPFEMQLP